MGKFYGWNIFENILKKIIVDFFKVMNVCIMVGKLIDSKRFLL